MSKVTEKTKIKLYLKTVNELIKFVQTEFKIAPIDELIAFRRRRAELAASTCSDFRNICETEFETLDTIEEEGGDE